MIKYLGFDPGKTTGWAAFNEKGEVIAYGQVSLEELMDLCEKWSNEPTLAVIVYESFVLFKHKARAQTGSRMEASQAIGIIKSLGRKTGAVMIEQDPTIKSIAQKWTQLKPVGDHSQSHWVDAFNHCAYWLINEGIRDTYLVKQQKEKANGLSTDS